MSNFMSCFTAKKMPIVTKKTRILCLHGWRTSAKILEMQMAAWRANIPAKYEFINGPFPATGPPDEGISTFYPDYSYFEWYLKDSTAEQGIERSIDYIISVLLKAHEEGYPFDGILGFSQGAAMATRVIVRLQKHCATSSTNASSDCLSQPVEEILLIPTFAVLIGGVPPPELLGQPVLSTASSAGTASETPQCEAESCITTTSLHIMGEADHLLPHCKNLLSIYSPDSRTAMQHSEGHHIPSMRTNLYPGIKAWIEEARAGARSVV